MAGYECERFVSLSDTDSSDLSCYICHNILRDPVVAKCCQQEFCRQCVEECIQLDGCCPVSKGKLTIGELISPSRIITNRLKELQIHCYHQIKGCKEVMKLEVLAKHELICPLKDQDCLQCLKSQCFHGLGIKCIRDVDIEYRKMKKRNAQLKRRNDYLRPEVITTNLNPEKAAMILDVIRKKTRGRRNLQSNADRIRLYINRYKAEQLAMGSRGRWRVSPFCISNGDPNLQQRQYWCSVRYFHALFNVYVLNGGEPEEVVPQQQPQEVVPQQQPQEVVPQQQPQEVVPQQQPQEVVPQQQPQQ